MKVPFLDLKPAYRELQVELDAAWRRVMESGWYILGEEVEAFEREFAAYCGAKHCVGVGNGLDALILILRGYEIGLESEVIVPPIPTSPPGWLFRTWAAHLSRLSPIPERIISIQGRSRRP